MATEFEPCEQLERVARELIQERHQHLNRPEVEIRFSQRDDIPTEGDYQAWGTVRKKSGEDAFHIRGGSNDPLFLISIPSWTITNLDDETFRAMVDHLLCFCDAARDENGVVKLSKNVEDFHGFNRNIEHFGLWHERFSAAFSAMKGAPQLALPMDGSRPALAIAGMGELGEDEDEIPPAYRRACSQGHAWDLRQVSGTECPMCGQEAASQELDATDDYAPTDDERDEVRVALEAEAGLTVVNGGAHPEANGNADPAPATRRRGVSRKSLRAVAGGTPEAESAGDAVPAA